MCCVFCLFVCLFLDMGIKVILLNLIGANDGQLNR